MHGGIPHRAARHRTVPRPSRRCRRRHRIAFNPSLDPFGARSRVRLLAASSVCSTGGQAAGTRSAHGGASQWLRGHLQRRHAAVRNDHHRDREGIQGIHGGGTSRDEGARSRAESGHRCGPCPGKATGRRVLAKIAEMTEPDRAMAERLHAIIKLPRQPSRREPGTGRPLTPRMQCRLLLPERAEVQNEVRDVRVQRQGEPRRRRHGAGGLRAQKVDRRRRGQDRRARRNAVI